MTLLGADACRGCTFCGWLVLMLLFHLGWEAKMRFAL
jgi:hypothetical protein